MAADRRVVLRGLSPAELGPALLEATGETIDPPAVGALYRRTGGNPFFAAEVVRLLRAENRLSAGVDSAVPAGVRAVLDRRIDRLPEATEAVMRAAAVLDAGTSTGVDTVLLAGVADVPPVELAERSAPSVDGRLLVVDGGRYRFAHALVADTVAARTPPAWRLGAAPCRGGGARQAGGCGCRRPRRGRPTTSSRWRGCPGTPTRRVRPRSGVRWLPAPLFDGPLTRTLSGGSTKAWWCWPICRRVDSEASCSAPSARPRLRRVTRPGPEVPSRTPSAHARRHRHPDLLAAAALGLTGGAAGFEVDLSDPDRIEPLEEALAGAAHRGLTAALRGVGPAVGRVGLHRGRAAPSRPRRHRRRGGPEAGRPARARRRARRPL